MQPHPAAQARLPPEQPQLKSRLYVQLFSWFGLLIAILHLFEGHSVGILQFLLSLIGIYASWDDVTNRVSFVSTYAIGCAVWTVLDLLYFILLVCAASSTLREALVNLVVSNTFPNLSTSLDKLLADLAADVHFFTIFSAVTSVLFDTMAAYWAFSLHNDALEAIASSELRIPVFRAQPSYARPRVAGFGTLSRPPPNSPSPRALQPFPGRGHRLGAGDP